MTRKKMLLVAAGLALAAFLYKKFKSGAVSSSVNDGGGNIDPRSQLPR